MYDYYGDGASLAFLALIYGVVFILAIVVYIVGSIFLMKVFEKAGVQGKWRAWVPVYNFLVFAKLGDVSPWAVLIGYAATIVLGWIPLIGWLLGAALFAIVCIAAWRVGLKLQKSAAWVVLFAAGFVTGGLATLIWLGINGFDKSRWNANIAPAPWAGNGFLADKTVWSGIPVQPSAAAPQQGYGAAPQGYAPPAPQGYAPPAQPGYAPPAQPGYAPPAAPAAPATGAPVPPSTPPAAPSSPPAPPTAPPAAPPAPPAAPPAAPFDPTQPPA
jgi:hypothetical protein